MEERHVEGKVIMVTGASGVLAMHLIKQWQMPWRWWVFWEEILLRHGTGGLRNK